MLRFLKKVLSFGMADVDRVGYVRTLSVRVKLPIWDRPPRSAVEKVLKKFLGKEEAAHVLNQTAYGSVTVLSDDAQARSIESALLKCLKTDRSSIQAEGPCYFDGHIYEYIQDYCNDCGREGYVYRHSSKGYICDACGSSDVVVLSDMKPKEVEKHVRKKHAA